MELRTVQQLAKDQRDLSFENPGSVVLHADFVAVVAHLFYVNPDFGQDTSLFTGVQRIVDGFFHRGKQCFAGIVEAQQMSVLGEELADGNIALLGGHRLGGSASLIGGRAVGGCARRGTRRSLLRGLLLVFGRGLLFFLGGRQDDISICWMRNGGTIPPDNRGQDTRCSRQKTLS